nr:retrovirus-related Pol polyprotein from transposon TNT 1-94 [Tanacetum cinerariifolium]
MSINHEKYTLVIVDEYSSYTWVNFLRKKSQAAKIIISFIRMVENQNDVKIKQIRTNNGSEFRNSELRSFCDKKGISHNFSFPYTPKQNGVAERKNKTLIEAARTMLNGLILFKVFNIRREQKEETYHDTLDKSMEAIRFTNTLVDEIGIDDSSRYPPVPKVTQSQIMHHASTSSHLTPQDRWSRDQHIKLVIIISDPTEGMLTRSMAVKLRAALTSECLFANFLFEIEPKKNDKVISICQEKYTRDLLKKYEIFDSSSVKTPMVPPNNLGPDLSNPKESHLIVVKRILGYLKGTPLVEKVPQVHVNCLEANWFIKVQRNKSQWLYPLTRLVRPLNEFIIKFIVKNGQTPLTLDFKTFCKTTRLDYNKGGYVAHPSLEVVKVELVNIDINEALVQKTPLIKSSFLMAWRIMLTFVIQNPSKVTQIELMGSMIDVINLESSVTPLPCFEKKGKKKSQYVTQPKPKSQGHENYGALPQKRKVPRLKRPTLFKPVSNHPKRKYYILKTVADIQALLRDSKDELIDDSDEELLEYENTDVALINLKGSLTESGQIMLQDLIRSSTTGLHKILNNLRIIQNAVKEDSALNKEVLKAAKAYTKNASNLTKLLNMVKNFDFPNLKPAVTPPKTEIIGSSLRTQLTDPIVEVLVPQPKSLHTTSKPYRGKGIARDTGESPPKLVKALTKVHMDPDTPLLIPSKINCKLYHLTNEEIQAHMKMEGRKPETIIDILIYLNEKPVAIIVYRGSDRRTFKVHNPFRFGDFGIAEWDELNESIPKKKNKVVGELMTSLGKKCDRLKAERERHKNWNLGFIFMDLNAVEAFLK